MTDTLYARSGSVSSEAELRSRLQALAPPPEFALCEPRIELRADGAPGRIPGFNALSRGLPDLTSHPLAELLLCWRNACLRIVADGANVRWAALVTDQARLPFGNQGEEAPPLKGLDDRRRNVLFRGDRDLARFRSAREGDGPATIKEPKICVREFRQSGRVVAWWLVDAQTEETADA